MKLAEALRIVGARNPEAPEYTVTLLAGSTPEPLSHFLAAHLQRGLPEHQVVVETGRFGGLPGNLARYVEKARGPAALVLEWADLDARLGIRQPGSWGRSAIADVLATVGRQLQRLGVLLRGMTAGGPVALSPPGLPLPPLAPTPPQQWNPLEAGLAAQMAEFLAETAGNPAVRILSLDRISIPMSGRLDVRSWLQAGFPYRLLYAAELGESLAALLLPQAPAKGLITDLDNTLWEGILGEIGPDQISWSLERHSSLHGTYQQFLQSLAADGVLLAAASKNDRTLVAQALARPDLLLRGDSLFPVEANWGPKPQSVERILRAWNIGADSVVFVDDSPMEVAAVQAAFPSMDCRSFPAGDPDALWWLLADLRGRFARAARLEEDELRLASVRGGVERQTLISAGSSEEDLLRDAGGVLTIARLDSPPDPRALELVNKTNQFNLNGRRYTESEWLAYVGQPHTWVWMASYRDRFGPLGRIAVLGAACGDGRLDIDCWVMSCRAFSRRIEHALLDFVFQHAGVNEAVPRFQPTERNGPLREFLEAIAGQSATGPVHISRAHFDAVKPPSYMLVETAH
jgi:FkbH-like protein